MCTSIIEIARAEGMAKRGDEWFPLSQALHMLPMTTRAMRRWATSSRSTSSPLRSNPGRGLGLS